MVLHFEPNLLSAGMGLSGSFFLMADVINLKKDIILQTTGIHREFYSSYENDTQPLLERRINTVFGAVFIFLSYFIQMLNTVHNINLFVLPYDWWDTWSLLAIITGVAYFMRKQMIKKIHSRKYN